MKIHELKIWAEHIDALAAGTKTFEIRSTADRTFEVGDILCLNEYNPADRLYSGRQIRATVVGVHTGLGVAPGFAVLSLAKITRVGGWVEAVGPGDPPELKLPGSGPELAAMVQEIQTNTKRPGIKAADPFQDAKEVFAGILSEGAIMKVPYESVDCFLESGGIIRIEGNVILFDHNRFDIPNLKIDAKVCSGRTINELYLVAVKAAGIGIAKYHPAGAKT